MTHIVFLKAQGLLPLVSVEKRLDPHRDPHAERSGKHRREGICLFSGAFSCVHMTCVIKLPIFSAACSCICRVAWV